MRIVGLDPGLRRTGWGIIEFVSNKLIYIAHGIINVPVDIDFAQRLRDLHHQVEGVIKRYQPHEAAVEETFVNVNPSSTLKLGMARGVIILAPAQHHIPVYHYAPNLVKKSLVGVGHAEKNQMISMVRYLLPKCQDLKSDSADALAIAICHAHHRPIHSLMKGA